MIIKIISIFLIFLFIGIVYFKFLKPEKKTLLIPTPTNSIQNIQKIENLVIVTSNNNITKVQDEAIFGISDIDYYKTPKYNKKEISLYEKDIENNNVLQREDFLGTDETNIIINEQVLLNITQQINDSQNVHDSFVQKDSLKLYKENPENNNNDESIRGFLYQSDYPNKSQISNILDKIENRNSILTNFDNNTEIEILNNTWGKSISNNQKISFFDALLDSLSENGQDIVCPTGVCTRLISNLQIENPEKMPKSKNLYTQEILQKTSFIRNKYPDISIDDFKTILIKELLIDYPNLTSLDIQNIIKPWINDI